MSKPFQHIAVTGWLLTAVTLTAAPLPDNVEKREVTIWSDGVRMAGDLYLPKGLKPDEKLPAVLFCAGTSGTKKGTPQQLAPRFVQAGFVFLAFDYRGWGESDSRLMTPDKQPKPDAKSEVTVRARAIRWQMDFADQAMDIRAAISFLAGEPNVDPQRIGIMGSSYGGGLVTWTAGNDPRVKCVAAQVAGMGGGRGSAAERYAYGLATKQARAETEPVPFETGKMGGKMARYEHMRVNPVKSIGFNAIEAAEKVRAPMIIIDAENEELMDRHQNGERVAEILKSRGVPVAYHVLKGITHYGIYREGFEGATRLELEWFAEHLKKPAAAKDSKKEQ
ncbi:MAG: prolyl oligopeptidase family serine peptidase [Verrucomicrobia bacterium]|nr:prolyl oligopeptidase family serine peptidase [Verrucomicrobiota bacterium]